MPKEVTLTGKVTAIYAPSRYGDAQSRIKVKVDHCALLSDELVFRNDCNLDLDDVCVVTITAAAPPETSC